MTLPVELLDLIFPLCARGELYHVSLACRLFSNITRPLLYKHIVLDQPASVDLLLTLCCQQSSRISSLVQTLRIVILGQSMRKRLTNKEVDKYILLVSHGPSFVDRRTVEETFGYSGPSRYYQALNRALRRLCQLKSLDIEIHGVVSPKLQLDLTEALFEGCIFNLQTFKTNLAVDAGLANFLSTQPHLKSLGLMHNTTDQASQFPGSRRSTSNLHPHTPGFSHSSLHTLTVSDLLPQSTINYTYKFGQVKEFNILFLNPINRRDYLPPCLKTSLVKRNSVKYLRVTYLNQLVPGHFQLMASQMPNVQILEIKASVLTKDALDQMAAALEEFPLLQGIILHSHSFRGPFNHEGLRETVGLYKNAFPEWFKRCDSLNDISLPQYRHYAKALHVKKRLRWK
ncbi:hypothetical protein BJ165DRAFT_1411156 [Panaeolus papilionaceus]|nr:hypothetical protein BJ165DRAFT_1411156 [Panaeolus papilionaceus]